MNERIFHFMVFVRKILSLAAAKVVWSIEVIFYRALGSTLAFSADIRLSET